jgi:deoxyribodipyrimidine photo-lyase
MDITQPIVVFWFRRDLRLHDNNGFYHALISGYNVLPVFIFDKKILDKLKADDKRVSFIYQALENMNEKLAPHHAAIQFYYDNPLSAFEKLLSKYPVTAVYANSDYEPYAEERDFQIKKLLASKGVLFYTFKDQVIFEKNEITKPSGEPYTVFTPYSRRWLENLNQNINILHNRNSENYLFNLVESDGSGNLQLSDIGFKLTKNVFQPYDFSVHKLENYEQTRDYPALDSTSRVSVHLRFGTVSIRHLVSYSLELNPVWLNELIWREFFMQILWNFPHVAHQSFKPKYQFIKWVNDEKDFDAWCKGLTGFPLVDAGMRELNATGFMHNRVRMVTASFLVKHLLINWQWGEAYFAEKLQDFELSSNNGNWQWAAGTGCDAAPYFRIFNPMTQAEKFDKDHIYIKNWVPEYGTSSYSRPIVDHGYARTRTLETYKAAL